MERYFCKWLWRLLLKTGKERTVNGVHQTQFEDFGDCLFWLTDEEVEKLERRD